MTPSEKIAADTWERLKLSRDLKVRLGEETLTDLFALDFVRFMPNHIKLFQFNKCEESERGADLEVRIHDVDTQAAILAVQAKKLYKPVRPHQIGGYYRLDARAKSQMEILEKYSQDVGAIPIYILYNYVESCDVNRYWHCCENLNNNKGQLGCTIVPSWNFRQAFDDYRRKNFDWIHKSPCALPWRCLFDCTQRQSNQGETAARRSLSLLQASFPLSDHQTMISARRHSDDNRNYKWIRFEPVEDAWPEWLWDRRRTTLTAEDRRELWGDFGKTDIESKVKLDRPTRGLIPRRLLLVKEKTR